MVDYPPLSIVIPAYKRAHVIAPLLRSLAVQAAPGDELLIIDDASGDEIAKTVADEPKFRLIRNESNLGMVRNWNACLQAARHDWICLVHHDDEVAPAALANLRRACSLAGGPALVAHWREYPELGDQFRCRWCEPGPWAVLKVPTIPSGAVVHRRIVEQMGDFDERWKYSADLEYFPRICQRFPLLIIESPGVIHYRLHGTNYQYETWKEPDFEAQLRAIQRLVVGYADLPAEAADRQFEARMAAMYSHMFTSAVRLGDRTLLRRVGKRLLTGRATGRKMRLRAGLAAVLGWTPGLGRAGIAKS